MPIKINGDKLMELLKSFNRLTGMRIVIFDDESNEIIAYPEQPEEYCALIRKDAAAKKQCDKCDINAFNNCKATGQLQVHKCHAGLIDAAVPIKDNNIILGYMMFGQILDVNNKNAAFNEIEKSLYQYGTDIGTLRDAFFKLKYYSNDQIKAASQIMEACACYLWLSELVSVKTERIINKIDTFIDGHLSEQFTVADICKELQLSKGKLYQISNQYFGMGLAEYVKNKRIQKAKKLLCESDYSINEIAAMIGICDYNYFYKVFKNEAGLSPGQYKKKNFR